MIENKLDLSSKEIPCLKLVEWTEGAFHLETTDKIWRKMVGNLPKDNSFLATLLRENAQEFFGLQGTSIMALTIPLETVNRLREDNAGSLSRQRG